MQTRMYRRTITLAQNISAWTRVFVGAAIVLALFALLFVYTGRYYFKWLDFVYFIFAVGEAAEWFKYVPQISVNFMCLSTAGFSPHYLAIEAADTVALAGYFASSHTAQPNSVFLLACFKALFVGYLVYQHLRVYRHQRIRSKRRYQPVASDDIELSRVA